MHHNSPSIAGPSEPKLLSVARIIRAPRATYQRWFATYGDPCLIRSYNGDIVVTAHPDLVRQVFAAPRDSYAPFGAEAVMPILGSSTIFALQGPAHLRERKLIMPPLHGSRMRHYGATIVDATRKAMRHVRPGDPWVVQEAAMAISLEVIIRAIFGVREPTRVKRFQEAIEQTVARAHPLLFFVRATQMHLWGWSPWDRFLRSRDRLDALIYEEIDRRSGQEGDDILSVLMQARYEDGAPPTPEHLRAQLMTLLIAGHETTALSLARAMELLHRHPLVLERLREQLAALDLDDPDTVARDPWLKAICQETLRLHPVLPDMLRTLKVPMTLGSVTIPAGYVVAAVATATHRDPSLYPDPDQFRPERFLERTYRPWEFYPFGGGHRRCPGAAFAMMEMALVLATLVHTWRFELREPVPVRSVRRNITMGPATGVRMRILEAR
ncbi:MAG: cytochrome P450 [Myxococcota bacterium]